MLPIRIFCFGLSLLVFAAAARAEICSEAQRDIKLNSGDNIKLSVNECKREPSGTALRVSRFRVSESVAGSLIKETPNPIVDEIIGRVKFTENDVYREARFLFDNYGTSKSIEPKKIELAPSIDINGSDASEVFGNNPLRVWYITAPDDGMIADRFFIKSPSQVILTTDRWPSGYNMDYSCAKKEKNFVSCTTIWKYIQPPEIDPILADVKEVIQRAEARLPARARGESVIPLYQKNFEFYRHLASFSTPAGWPDDFVYITTSPGPDECMGGAWQFSFGARRLVLDFLIVENIGQRSIRIDGFLGTKNPTDRMRLSSASEDLAQRPATQLGLGPVEVPAGGRVAIALRLALERATKPNFDPPDDQQAGEDSILSARGTYDRIRSYPQNHMFQESIRGVNGGRPIKKAQQNFREPLSPGGPAYAYGPEVLISGLLVDGSPFTIDRRPPNSVDAEFRGGLVLDLTPANVARRGSIYLEPICCPFLYSWRDDTQEWIAHGKVIHRANGPENAMTEVIPLASLRTRFRLAEEELEMSFINRVHLNIHLRDGSHLVLLPRQPIDPVIRAYSAVEFDFDLPAQVEAEKVVRTELEISGYYRPYETLMSDDTP